MDINAAASNAGSVKAVLDVTRMRSKLFFARASSQKLGRIPIRSLRYKLDIHSGF